MTRLLICFLTFAFAVLPSGATTINFEGFSDSTILTNQYAGITFANAIVLTSGISLNEFEFPPHSGANVVSDNGGPLTISFASPVTMFGGYFTYAEPLTIQVFGATNNLLATKTSLFSNNEALSGTVGSSPNEFDTLASLAGIYSVTITGDPLGGSFVMDDMTFSSAAPEPSSRFILPVLIILSAYLSKARGVKKREGRIWM